MTDPDEPIVPRGEGAAPRQPAAGPERSERSAARRVLIVDDNHDAAESLGALIELYGHTVAICYDGLDAVDLAVRFRPHVALVDLDLPRLNGYEVAEQLRARELTKSAVLVALSGYGGLEDKEEARARGFDEHLTKPADFGKLFALIAGAPPSD